MSNPRPIVVFTTLALNQTTFFGAVGEELQQKGYSIAFICFHERSAEYLRRRGLKAYNIYEQTVASPAEPLFERFGVTDVNALISHEKVAFDIGDSTELVQKLGRFLNAVDQILGEDANQGATVVQEFGGFISLIASYYAARARSMDNIFIEPSFFRGRVMLTRNSFAAPFVKEAERTGVSPEVNRYLDETLAQRQLVIPKKDTHHYRSAFRKVLDSYNFKRLLEKSFDKHVLGKKEEFNHIGGHVARHLRMLINGFQLKRLYRALPVNERFIYYPLHVPNDAALTVRSPEFLDQYAFLDYLVRVLPYGCKLGIKEHPALIGAIDYTRAHQLVSRYDNLVLFNPRLNNYHVMSKASAIVTVNSKSGAEALLLGKPVLVMGDAFYRRAPIAIPIAHLSDLSSVLHDVLFKPYQCVEGQIRAYFQSVWDSSWPGELYYNDPQNISNFVKSLESVIGDTGNLQVSKMTRR